MIATTYPGKAGTRVELLTTPGILTTLSLMEYVPRDLRCQFDRYVTVTMHFDPDELARLVTQFEAHLLAHAPASETRGVHMFGNLFSMTPEQTARFEAFFTKVDKAIESIPADLAKIAAVAEGGAGKVAPVLHDAEQFAAVVAALLPGGVVHVIASGIEGVAGECEALANKLATLNAPNAPKP